MKRLVKRLGMGLGLAVVLIALAVLMLWRKNAFAARYATWPEVSPDGSQVLFERDGSASSGGGSSEEIYVMAADGSQQRHVASGDQPRWLPDGKRILFTLGAARDSSHNTVTSVVVMNLDGTDRSVVPVSGLDVWRPTVSPDGREVAFGTRLGGPMHSMRLDGSALREIPNRLSGWSTEPTWSHDGRLAFVSWTRTLSWLPIARSTALCVMNADGTGQRQVAVLPHTAQWISWSPDDRKIAVQVDQTGGSGNIAVVDVATGAVSQVTHDDGTQINETPSWTPDGRLYFQSARSGRFEIYRMNADGAALERITRPSA